MSNTGSLVNSAYVGNSGQTADVGTWAASTVAATGMAFVDVLGLDRNEYTAASTTNTGVLSSGDQHLAFTQGAFDTRYVDIQYTLDRSTGTYVSNQFGRLNDLTYALPDSADDLVDFSVYAGNSQPQALSGKASPYDFLMLNADAYAGTASILANSGSASTTGLQSTPNAIADAAIATVGSVRSDNGCWIMASTLAAATGSALPVLSTLSGSGGQSSGEWIVAYDGSVTANSNWTDQLEVGDVISFITVAGTGHVTTVAKGSGQTAQLVDNATNGTNEAVDGKAGDVVVLPPHSQAGEFTGVDPSNVVIYRLDTPRVTDAPSRDTHALVQGHWLSVASLVNVTDPAGRDVTQFEVYHSGSSQLLLDGVATTADSEATAISVNDLHRLNLTTGSSNQTDTISIRASNGAYWGDWTSIDLTPGVAYTNSTTGTAGVSALAPIPGGGPDYLKWLYLATGSDNMAVSVSTPDTFILGGSGSKALSVTSGHNILNGGTGSSFLTGGSGTDTFFVDLKNDTPVWDTVRNFHAGDDITVWNWTAGSSMRVDANAGAAGAEGATLRLLAGNGDVAASVTFEGLSTAQVGQLVTSAGWQGTTAYLHLYNPGV